MDIDQNSIALLQRSKSLFSEIEAICGFKIPTECSVDFKKLHSNITQDPLPTDLKRLTIDGGSRRDWLTPFIETILNDVQEGLTACHYHLANIRDMEERLILISMNMVPDLGIKNSAIAGGNTRKLNFEYQAFAFAIRRTLEYFASSVASFFKSECNRIRKLSHSIAGQEPTGTNGKTVELINIHIEKLSDILPKKNIGTSVRDLLAHWKAIAAGVFNISERNNEITISFVGGGEKIKVIEFTKEESINYKEIKKKDITASLTLTPSLENQIQKIETFIKAVYSEMHLL